MPFLTTRPHTTTLAGFATISRLTAFAAALTLTACGSAAGDDTTNDADSGGTEGTQSTDTVTVQLDYQVRGNHAMFYVADELGYFADNGINVDSIEIGTGSPDTLRIVGNGQADFGFADLPSLATARSQDVPVTALAAVNQVSPLGVCAKSDRHTLTSVDDLQGMRAGIHTAGSTFIFYTALLAANGIDRAEMDEVTVTPPYENYLLQDRVDFVICYIDAEVPELESKAGGEGSLSILLGSDHGYNAYGSGLFTSNEMIEENPDLVQRFTDAYMQAFEYVVDNPDEAAQIVADSAPELAEKVDIFAEQLDADIEHTFTSAATEENGLGAMTEQMWQSTLDILVTQNVVEGEPPAVDALYDTSFIDSYHDEA